MSIIRIVEGQVLALREVFTDDFDDPILPSNQTQGPTVRLLDSDKDVVVEVIAAPDTHSDPGTWIVNIPIPVFDLRENIELPVIWTLIDEDGQKHRSKINIVVEPAVTRRKSDIVVLENCSTFELSLPFVFNPVTDNLVFDLYRNNEAQYNEPLAATDPIITIRPGVESTSFIIPANGVAPAKLEPISFLAILKSNGGTPVIYDFKLWSITPQMLVAASMVEDHINKARLENIIPELEYTKADLISYLQRGLGMFNGLPPHLSSFTGTNMQGPILDSWIICSCYYALSAQLQAEGAMAFDFSGQTVNLNIDRSPSVEAALGRLENLIDNHVKPFKKQLARAGVLSGTGAEGGQFMGTARSFGTLQISNAPTSRFGYASHRSFGGRGTSYRY